jgi:hypothetical protein
MYSFTKVRVSLPFVVPPLSPVVPNPALHHIFPCETRHSHVYLLQTRHDANWREFHHPYFRRGHPELLVYIRRKTNPHAGAVPMPGRHMGGGSTPIGGPDDAMSAWAAPSSAEERERYLMRQYGPVTPSSHQLLMAAAGMTMEEEADEERVLGLPHDEDDELSSPRQPLRNPRTSPPSHPSMSHVSGIGAILGQGTVIGAPRVEVQDVAHSQTFAPSSVTSAGSHQITSPVSTSSGLQLLRVAPVVDTLMSGGRHSPLMEGQAVLRALGIRDNQHGPGTGSGPRRESADAGKPAHITVSTASSTSQPSGAGAMPHDDVSMDGNEKLASFMTRDNTRSHILKSISRLLDNYLSAGTPVPMPPLEEGAVCVRKEGWS